MHDDSLQNANLSDTIIYSTHPNTTIKVSFPTRAKTKLIRELLTTDEQQEDIHATGVQKRKKKEPS